VDDKANDDGKSIDDTAYSEVEVTEPTATRGSRRVKARVNKKKDGVEEASDHDTAAAPKGTKRQSLKPAAKKVAASKKKPKASNFTLDAKGLRSQLAETEQLLDLAHHDLQAVQDSLDSERRKGAVLQDRLSKKTKDLTDFREKNSQKQKSLMERITKLQEEQAVSSKEGMALKKEAVSLRNQATKDGNKMMKLSSNLFTAEAELEATGSLKAERKKLERDHKSLAAELQAVKKKLETATNSNAVALKEKAELTLATATQNFKKKQLDVQLASATGKQQVELVREKAQSNLEVWETKQAAGKAEKENTTNNRVNRVANMRKKNGGGKSKSTLQKTGRFDMFEASNMQRRGSSSRDRDRDRGRSWSRSRSRQRHHRSSSESSVSTESSSSLSSEVSHEPRRRGSSHHGRSNKSRESRSPDKHYGRSSSKNHR
jgi:chromosome segregation ATPase